MSELNQMSKQEISFKEVFYEDEVVTERERAEVLKSLAPSEEYENIQQKIKELKETNLPKHIKKLENQGTMFIYGAGVMPAIVASLYMLIGDVFKFDIFALNELILLLFVFTIISGVSLGIYNLFKFERKAKEFEEQETKSLNNYHNQLLNSFFNGKVIGNVEDLSQENWTRINVLENGETETYMIKLKADDKGLEQIESMKVVEKS